MSGGTMTRLRRARTATLLCAVGLLTINAYAQQYSINVYTSIVGGGYLGTPPRTWQLYRENMVEIELSISLSSSGEDDLFFNTGVIEQATRVRLLSMDETTGELQETPVSVITRGIIENGIGPFITVPDHRSLAQGKGKSRVDLILVATLPEGRPFTPGRYRFEIEVRDIPSAIVTATGGPLAATALPYFWYGVWRGDVELVLTVPSTPAEVATMYIQRGGVAFERRQFEEAVASYRRAVDAAPTDAGTALMLLGGTYLVMQRYSDAVPVLQQLPILGPGRLEALLAEAYVGAGNDAEAMNLLQRGGRSQPEVVAEIERLRETVRRRPAP